MRRRLYVVGLLAVGIIAFFFPLRPDPVWERDPNTVVLELESFFFEEIDYEPYYSLPEARVFGDGRIVLKEYHTLREGQLTDQQLEQLLQQFIEQGFFSRDLSGLDILSYPNYSLTIQLQDRVKMRGWEYDELSEAEEAQLRWVLDGAGATQRPFQPQYAQIWVRAIDPPQPTYVVVPWPAAQIGYNLHNGLYKSLSGADLALLWQLMQQSPKGLFAFQGRVYAITFDELR